MAKEKRVSVRIPAELDEQVEELAERLGMSRSDVVRTALETGLADGRLVAGMITNPVVKRLLRFLMAAERDPGQMDLFEKALDAGAVPGDVPG